MSALDTEVLLAGAYALMLLCVAWGLDGLARLTHDRAQAYRTAGFAYDSQHDHWVCPEGEHLWPHEYDHQQRVVRYRAKAHVCNGCPIKERCTDSDRGREVVRALDPWPHSEAGRFHRGIALIPVVLAGLIVVIAAVRHPAAADLAALLALASLIVVSAWRLSAAFRGTPANFPAPSPSHGLRLQRKSRTTWGWEK